MRDRIIINEIDVDVDIDACRVPVHVLTAKSSSDSKRVEVV